MTVAARIAGAGEGVPLALDARDLQVGYGGDPVLRGVDMQIAAGEIVTLLGPNGAGKTTLMRSICGRIPLTSGTVSVAGRSGGSGAARRMLGFVPQEIALYPMLTPRENLRFFGRLVGLSRGALNAAVDRALQLTQLTDRANVLVQTLSGGYQRRLNIAAAILHAPRMLVLDEPMVGVDVNARQALQQVLLRLAEEGIGILLTTHDLEQAERVSDRVVILLQGELIRNGSVESLIAETFGDHREVHLTLLQQPEDGLQASLRGLGLAAVNGDALHWLGELESGLVPMRRLLEQLEDLQIAVREIRVRQPDLDTLYRRLTAGPGGVR